VNPAEAHIVEGELTHAIIPTSMKALDVLRDPRVYLHTPVLDAELGRPGEFKLRARAIPIEAEDLRHSVQDAVEARSGWRPPDDWRFFRQDIESAAFHEYDEVAEAHVLKRWTPKRGYESVAKSISV
jgi:hypothetical protein